MENMEKINEGIKKDLMKGEPKIVEKIINQEKEREKLYDENNLLEHLRQEFITEEEKIIGKKILRHYNNKLDFAEEFIKLIPLHFDDNSLWWKWDMNDYCWKIVDETSILVMIDHNSDSNVVNSREKTEYLNALRIKARTNKPKEINGKLLQFSKELINIETGDRFPATPEYFITNPIPHRLGRHPETPKLDILFSQWVKPNDMRVLYEILAYCLLPSYPIERIFALLGAGANGKSTYLAILRNFLGDMNCTTSSLESLQGRFESSRLHKKLAVIMSETNLASLEQSDKIKRLASGKDLVSIEYKGKGLSQFINYAKIIVATNNLPPTEDKTDGFYRRWRIIEFPNQFEKEKDILSEIDENEYMNLATKCLSILIEDILKKREFTGDGTISDRKRLYEEKSNPFDKFWKENIEDTNPDNHIPLWQFEQLVNDYMKENRARSLSQSTINKLMKDKNIQSQRIYVNWSKSPTGQDQKYMAWLGISIKKKIN